MHFRQPKSVPTGNTSKADGEFGTIYSKVKLQFSLAAESFSSQTVQFRLRHAPVFEHVESYSDFHNLGFSAAAPLLFVSVVFQRRESVVS